MYRLLLPVFIGSDSALSSRVDESILVGNSEHLPVESGNSLSQDQAPIEGQQNDNSTIQVDMLQKNGNSREAKDESSIAQDQAPKKQQLQLLEVFLKLLPELEYYSKYGEFCNVGLVAKDAFICSMLNYKEFSERYSNNEKVLSFFNENVDCKKIMIMKETDDISVWGMNNSNEGNGYFIRLLYRENSPHIRVVIMKYVSEDIISLLKNDNSNEKMADIWEGCFSSRDYSLSFKESDECLGEIYNDSTSIYLFNKSEFEQAQMYVFFYSMYAECIKGNVLKVLEGEKILKDDIREIVNIIPFCNEMVFSKIIKYFRDFMIEKYRVGANTKEGNETVFLQYFCGKIKMLLTVCLRENCYYLVKKDLNASFASGLISMILLKEGGVYFINNENERKVSSFFIDRLNEYCDFSYYKDVYLIFDSFKELGSVKFVIMESQERDESSFILGTCGGFYFEINFNYDEKSPCKITFELPQTDINTIYFRKGGKKAKKGGARRLFFKTDFLDKMKKYYNGIGDIIKKLIDCNQNKYVNLVGNIAQINGKILEYPECDIIFYDECELEKKCAYRFFNVMKCVNVFKILYNKYNQEELDKILLEVFFRCCDCVGLENLNKRIFSLILETLRKGVELKVTFYGDRLVVEDRNRNVFQISCRQNRQNNKSWSFDYFITICMSGLKEFADIRDGKMNSECLEKIISCFEGDSYRYLVKEILSSFVGKKGMYKVEDQRKKIEWDNMVGGGKTSLIFIEEQKSK